MRRLEKTGGGRAWRTGWRETDVKPHGGEAQLKKTKHYCCLVTQGQVWGGGGVCVAPPLTHAQIHTGGRGDACVGTKVFPLPKLKPLITNRETREREREEGEREGGGRCE